MSEAAVTPTVGAKAKPKAKAKSRKSKSSATHPKYMEMSMSAITDSKDRNGLSRQAILKYILDNYEVGKDAKAVNTHLKLALKRGVSSGVLKQAKGQGATGSFRLSDKVGPVVRKPRKKTLKRKAPAKAEKPVVEKPKVEKVEKVEKAKTPKKKTPKKKKAPVAKSPKKVGAKRGRKPKGTKIAGKKSPGRPKKLKSPKKTKK